MDTRRENTADEGTLGLGDGEKEPIPTSRRPARRTQDLLRTSRRSSVRTEHKFAANGALLVTGRHVAPPRVSAECPLTQTHNPTDDAEKACYCRPFLKRLMGFEPTTFCMASRAWGYADCIDIPANKGVQRPRAAAAIPAFHREITRVWGLKAD
jgi:hypothetical protein